MKALLMAALQTIVRSLVGSIDYERIKLAVIGLSNNELSGTDKKQIVMNEFAYVAEAVGRDLLSIAVKTAVLMMRNGK
jgi:uncharacterized protein YwlG (UPF0340 family)